MPRTKRPTSKRSKHSRSFNDSNEGSVNLKEQNIFFADIDRQFDGQISRVDQELETALSAVTHSFNLLLLKISPEWLDKPLRELELFEELSKEMDEVSSTSSNTTIEIPQTCPKRPRVVSQTSFCKEEQDVMPPPTTNRFRTPMFNVGNSGRYNLITPKIQPNSCLSILRRPREGEMALSMSGSPLLVSSVTHDSMANINVPLPNGSVMSILPQAGLRPNDIPQMDKETKEQLRRLKDNLASFLRDE